ncbi:DEAD/DEAH box helicase [Methylorubrum extorquens]|uniref:DEAD/DEAH box helicase n=1 Tax=Methylorubrum extorquens TaxID=408 RepID=UPI00209E07DD|nr:DEAD/DEAH box helicase [Methylorubrum extorquens]MCP1537678.1 superfamily II DNA/RNA helicase [Methylorubrum extorquens]
MFDPTTENLIAAAPRLRGAPDRELAEVDPTRLAQELSAAFSELAAIRLKHRKSDVDRPGMTSERPIDIRRLYRIAATYEARVVISDGEVDRSASFVAAICQQLIFDMVQLRPEDIKPTYISSHAISSNIVSALLFVAAEAHADAYTGADRISVPTEKSVRNDLKFLIQNLCRAQFSSINIWDKTVGVSLVAEEGRDLYEVAADYLYQLIAHGIVIFAQEMLGLREIGQAEKIFQRARDKSAAAKEITSIGASHFTIPGVHHLACLLIVATSGLGELALIRTRPPAGHDGFTDEEQLGTLWSNALKSLAQRRPLVWRNHRAAIEGGLLDAGTSAVMNFPTGSGKTTLASLKIISTRLTKGSTIYLAPTHALCDQIRSDLNRDLAGIGDVEVGDIEAIELSEEPIVYVMTPEQCLAGIAFRPEFFDRIGLLVFDECHLLHPSASRGARRSLDAMLTLLAFIDTCPKADLLLLSAMIRNAGELANWLESIGKAPCIAFEDPWKPTRQARAAVIYEKNEIRSAARDRKAAPLAQPYGVFNLRRGWNPVDPESNLVSALISKRVQLGFGPSGITSNRNQVAIEIADATQIGGLNYNPKVLIFAENKNAVRSIARSLNQRAERSPPELTAYESVMQRMIKAEFGAEYEHLNPTDAKVGVHFGDMLPCERNFVESLFKRAGGYNILVATSTLAQGLNLPCEIVIMAGTDRFDESAERPKRESIPAHDLLNALGRAGRAGTAAAGVSIVVPGPVITFEGKSLAKLRLNPVLNAVFSESDNCLVVNDPLSSILLDKLDAASAYQNEDFKHAMNRLRLSFHSDKTGAVGGIISKSLSAYRARLRGDEKWVEDRIAKAVMLLGETVDPAALGWRDSLAAHAGLPVGVIHALEAQLESRRSRIGSDVAAAITVLIECITADASVLLSLLRPANVEKVLGTSCDDCEEVDFHHCIIDVIQAGIAAWVTGETVSSIENTLYPIVSKLKATIQPKPRRQQADCPIARRFILNLVPDIGFAASIIGQIAFTNRIDSERGPAQAEAVLLAAAALRHGFCTADQITIHSIYRENFCRVEVHRVEQILRDRGYLSFAGIGLSKRDNYLRISGIIEANGGVNALAEEVSAE